MRKIVKIIAVYVLSILLAYGTAFLAKNLPLIGSGHVGTFSISDYQTTTEQKEDGDYITTSFDNNGEYINKLQFDYDASADFAWSLEADRDVSTETDAKIVGNNSARIHIFSEPVEGKTGSAKLTIITPSGETVEVKNLRISNEFQYFGRLYILFIALGITISTLVLFRKKLKGRPEWIFLAIVIPAGLATIAIEPVGVGRVTDEQIHYQRIHETIGDGADETIYSSLGATIQNTEEESQALANYANETPYLKDGIKPKLTFSSLAYLGFLPGQLVGVILNLDLVPMTIIMFASNLIIYSIVIFFAIRKTPIGKYILLVLALTPKMLHIAVNFSYDSTLFMFMALGISFYLYEIIREKDKLDLRNTLVILLSFVVVAAVKPPYIVMLLPVLFLPKTKFINPKRRRIFKAALFGIIALLGSTFILNSVISDAEIIDTRGGDVSIGRQLAHAVKNPMDTVKVVGYAITRTPTRTFRVDNFQDFVYLGRSSQDNNAYFVILSLLVIAIIIGLNNRAGPRKAPIEISKKQKIIIAITLVLNVAAIWVSMWLCFTPVGLTEINGVQGRYFVPLLFPLLCLFCTSKIKAVFKEEAIYRLFVILILFAIYSALTFLV